MGQVFEIVLVDDSKADIDLAKTLFENGDIKFNLNVVEDSEEAISFFKSVGKLEFILKPNLIILDLNMPKINGHSILKEIKKNNALNEVPVVIMTSSKSNIDAKKSFELKASAHLIKPDNLQEQKNNFNKLKNFLVSKEMCN